ncbi:hypothetical protein M433DRAFT_152176, partial [Acidomyces richmondensis BFW]
MRALRKCCEQLSYQYANSNGYLIRQLRTSEQKANRTNKRPRRSEQTNKTSFAVRLFADQPV